MSGKSQDDHPLTEATGGEMLSTLSAFLGKPAFTGLLAKMVRNDPELAIRAMKFVFLNPRLFGLLTDGRRRLEDFCAVLDGSQNTGLSVGSPTFGVFPEGKAYLTFRADPQVFTREACFRGGWNIGEISEFISCPETAKAVQEFGGFMPVFFPAMEFEELRARCSGFRPPDIPRYANGEKSQAERFPLGGVWRFVEVWPNPYRTDFKGYGFDDKVPEALGLRTCSVRGARSPRFETSWKDLQEKKLKPLAEKLGVTRLRLTTVEEWNFLANWLLMLRRVFGRGWPDITESGNGEMCQNRDFGNFAVLENLRKPVSFLHRSESCSGGSGMSFRLIADLEP